MSLAYSPCLNDMLFEYFPFVKFSLCEIIGRLYSWLWFTRLGLKNLNLTCDMQNFHSPFTAQAHDCSLNHSMTLNKAFDCLIGPFAEIKYRPGADIHLPGYLNSGIIHCDKSRRWPLVGTMMAWGMKRSKAVKNIYCHWFTMNLPCWMENSCSFWISSLKFCRLK